MAIKGQVGKRTSFIWVLALTKRRCGSFTFKFFIFFFKLALSFEITGLVGSETCSLRFHLVLVFVFLSSCDYAYNLTACQVAEGERLKYLLILNHSLSYEILLRL